MILARHILAATAILGGTLALALAGGPTVRAQSSAPPRELVDQDAHAAGVRDANIRDAFGRANRSVAGALVAARNHLALPRDPSVLADAAEQIRRGRHDEARELAERILEVPQPPELLRVARDLAGYAALRQRAWSDAAVHLDEAHRLDRSTSPLHRCWRDAWRSRAHLRLDDASAALDAAEAALASDDAHNCWHEARWNAAIARLRLTRADALSIRAVERLFDTYPEYPERASVLLEIAALELETGRASSARDRLDRFVWEEPWHPLVDEAEALLDDAARRGASPPSRDPEAWLGRAQRLRQARAWSRAEALLRRLDEDANPENLDFLHRVRWQRALNAYEAGRLETAHATLVELDGSPHLDARDLAWYRARTLGQLGEPEEAWRVLSRYFDRRPRAEADRALGELSFDAGLWDRALQHRYGSPPVSAIRTFEPAFLTYLAGRHRDAATAFRRIADASRGQASLRARYWLGRALQSAGDLPAARIEWMRVADASSFDYYAVQARNRLLEFDLATPTLQTDAAASIPPTPLVRPGRIHWLGPDEDVPDRFSPLRWNAPEPLAPPSAHAPADFAKRWGDLFPAAAAAASLFEIGALDEARLAFRDVIFETRQLDDLARKGKVPRADRPVAIPTRKWAHRIDNRRRQRGWWGIELAGNRWPIPNPPALRAELARRQTRILDARGALRADQREVARALDDAYLVRRFAFESGDVGSRLPDDRAGRLRWEDAWPTAYSAHVIPASERFELSPYLVWSLMIVESELNPDSISHADAFGLMQVIPRTGRLIAEREGTRDFGIHALLEVGPSIHFGTWYLRELLLKFEGQEMLALVAYNAGPHAVARWLDYRGRHLELDEFIETVPFDSARRYPQKILRNLAIYRALYDRDATAGDTRSPLYVGNQLHRGYRSNIQF